MTFDSTETSDSYWLPVARFEAAVDVEVGGGDCPAAKAGCEREPRKKQHRERRIPGSTLRRLEARLAVTRRPRHRPSHRQWRCPAGRHPPDTIAGI